MRAVDIRCVPIVACALLLASGRAHAVGETGAQFLRIGVGAKACAMGEAFVAVADDPSAIYWNPAGLTQVSSVQIAGMHSSWLLDMSYEWFGAVVPTGAGAFAAAVSYSSSGEIPRVEDLDVVGEYSAYDMAASLAYARGFGDMLSLGVGVKLVKQRIEEEEASGFAGDVGVLLCAQPDGGLRFGFSALNVGPAIAFIEEKDPLPTNLRGGISYERGPVTAAVALNQPRDGDMRWSVGAEYVIADILSLRAGYNSSVSYSAGLGLTWRKLSVEYAYVPYEDIDDTHRISALLAF
jgi:long-subunit fatty acid transport protein